MGDSSTIEWTDATWNPVTGCDRVSAGCDNCYIERTIPFRTEGRRFDERGRMGIRLHPDRLDKPLHWRKPRRVFVNSLSDLFHQDVPGEYIAAVWAVMAAADRHTFQVLTKRPQRMATWVERSPNPIAPNVWLGTSVENQQYADLRIPHLLATPAAVRFLSIEPLLGPVDIEAYLLDEPEHENFGPRVDWVIVGGESGPGARPMHPDWVRSTRDQCVAAGVPFFFKQWGEWRPSRTDADNREHSLMVKLDGCTYPLREPGPWSEVTDAVVTRVGKKLAGRELDGRTWDEYPA